MEKAVEICGTREGLIHALSDAQETLQNADTTELVIKGEGEAPDFRLHFTREDQPRDDTDTPWVRTFTE